MNLSDFYDFLYGESLECSRNNLILFGASAAGKEALNLLKDASKQVDFFCDNNEKLHGKYINGVKVLSPEELRNISKKVILITSMYEEEISNQLESLNIKNYLTFKEFNEFRHYKDNIKDFDNFITVVENVIKKILVYQMGKVASSTVVASLEAANVDSIHMHDISHLIPTLGQTERKAFTNGFSKKNICKEITKNIFNNNINEVCSYFDTITEISQNKQFYYYSFRDYVSSSKDCVKIITLIRKPLERNISAMFQNLENYLFVSPPEYNETIIEYLIRIFNKDFTKDFFRNWFKGEFERSTGINILKYPFDKEKGYTHIRHGNFDVLAIRAENLNDCEKIIGNFVEVDNFNLISTNYSKHRWHAEIYKKFKEEYIPSKELIDTFIKSKYVRHFYTEKELMNYYEKYY